MLTRIILIIFCSTSFFYGFAQFGNLGKRLSEKAGELMKEKLVEETDDKRTEYDTTSFTYAIAFLDKSESFENKQEGQGLVKTANFLMKEDQEKSDLDKARDLYEFGRINYVKRSYKVGEVYLSAALISYEALGATDDPVYLKTLGTLGLLYSDMGRYEGSEELTRLALEGWKDRLGEASTGYAAESNNLAVLQFNKGEYSKAEKDLKQAIKLVKAAEGGGSVPYAITLNNLGILYQYMGRSEEALDMLNQCLKIAEDELQEKSGTYLQLLTNKALILQENEQFDQAEAVYKEALDLQTSRLKLNRKSDPDYAHMLNNLASLYVLTDRNDEAEALLKESLEIYKSKFGELHPLVATAQADLGNLYRYQGKNDQASTLLVKALATRKDKLGEQHPTTVQSMEDLAIIRWKQGNVEEAKQLFNEVMEYSLSYINDFFPPLSEVEKTKYWEKMKPRFFTYYNFAFEHASKDPSLLEKAANYRLATKGLLLNATTKIKNLILSGEDQELIALYNQWQDQKRTLASYYDLSKEEITEQKINIDSMERVANQSERELSERSSSFADAFVSKTHDYQEISSSLSTSEVAIEIIQFPKYENSLTTDNQYGAILFKNGVPLELAVIENGNSLDTRFYALYKNLIKQKVEDEYSYTNFWKPIASHLDGGFTTVYFSPDGVYNQVNLNTLKNPQGNYLVEDLDIHIIGSPIELVDRTEVSQSSKSAFLLGYPDYGTSEIVSLPGTKKEIDQISSVLQAGQYTLTKLLRSQATEQSIKQATNPRLMHIATHGYFLEDVQSTGNVFGVQIEYARNNPLLRSGLMLAGADRAMSTYSGESFNQDDNGILTAYEAMNLHLNETDLVVLSACETGVGDVKSGEGVYGLQRAFMIAGAQKMIMSLWKVDDAATQQLMSSFYTLWINKSMKPDKAFRQAQLNLMKTYANPYYWGAFVMVE